MVCDRVCIHTRTHTCAIACCRHTCVCVLSTRGCVLSCTRGSVWRTAVCKHTNVCIALCKPAMCVCLRVLSDWCKYMCRCECAVGSSPAWPQLLGPALTGSCLIGWPCGVPPALSPLQLPPDPEQGPMHSGKVSFHAGDHVSVHRGCRDWKASHCECLMLSEKYKD